MILFEGVDMSILLYGDSHTDIFLNMPNVNRFETRLCKSGIMTIHRFTDPNDTDLWNALDPWFVNTQGNHLVISVGEIDIRAHFWRHLPRHYESPQSILDFVDANALKFYQGLDFVCKKYSIGRVVVWGAPVAGVGAHYNFEVPFSGPSQTRNRLVHLWNKSFVKLIQSDPRISFASAFYNFIDPTTYSTVIPSPSHDGVHWHHSHGTQFWNMLIKPALDGTNLCVGDNWNIMADDNFDMADSISYGEHRYDSWVRTDQVINLEEIHKTIIINGNPYSWISADQRNLLPEKYLELSLC